MKLFLFFPSAPREYKINEIHKQLPHFLWLRAKLDPIKAANLTQICIVAFFFSAEPHPHRYWAPFFLHCICQIKPNEGSSIFSTLLSFLVPAFVLWLQVSYIIHEDWETYPVLAILAVIPLKEAIFKSWIGHRWRQGEFLPKRLYWLNTIKTLK